MLNQYKKHFAEILHTVLPDITVDELVLSIEIPPAEIPGDLAFPCFKLSKVLKQSPNAIASEIMERLKNGKLKDEGGYFDDFKNLGGYVNAFIKSADITGQVINKIIAEKAQYGQGEKKNETIVIESPGPNTNKPLHIGHVRNMLLGNALSEIVKLAGFDVQRVDIINDRGIHICKSMLAYQKFGNNQEPDKKTDHFVGDRYVRYAKELEAHPEMEEEVKVMLGKRETHDPETLELRKKMNHRAISGQQETYRRFGTIIDKAYLESDHYLKGKDIVMDFFNKGVFVKDDKGNIVFQSKDESQGNKAVLRSDGTSIYSTQDIGLAKIRFDDFHMDRMIYIVGNEQLEYFKVLFEIFHALGFPFADKCYHMAYGMISIPGGKMKSREGTVVDADNLADELKDVAAQEIKERYPDIADAELQSRAENISLGAIKFFMLKYEVGKNFVFDPKESLAFEGETGPYIQYTYARCFSILHKNGAFDSSVIDINKSVAKLIEPEEKNLIVQLAEFPNAVQLAANEYKPNVVARYTIELCKVFNNFYQKHKVLCDDKDLENGRLLLVECVRQTIENGLRLLGINTTNEM